jgi:glycosyltransferase involved in cell wall biosynthesis
MKIRLAYDYHAFIVASHGGVARYLTEIASRLSQSESFDVRLFALGYLSGIVGKAVEKKYVVGFERPRIPKTTRLTIALNSLGFRMWAGGFAPHIVHETYYAAVREAPRGSRIVLTVYDFILEKRPPEACEVNVDVDRLRAVKSQAIRRSDHLICISNRTKADLLEFFDVPEAKISVIPLGYSLRSTGTPPGLDRILPGGARSPYILFVGTRGYWKNFERLVRAYGGSERLRRDFQLVCFGYNPFSQAERDLLSAVGLKESEVVQVGGDDDVLAALYRHAACLVYPSLYEGFGIPLLEAMSFDCPVICSDISSLPEVAGDAAEYFDPYEVEDMQAALTRVLYSAERANDLVARGRRRIRQFSWEKCAEETGRVYQSLV